MNFDKDKCFLKISYDKLMKDEGEETLKMRNIDNKFASYEMRKDEIKEYLVNTSMNQGVSTLCSLYLARWWSFFHNKHVMLL